MFRKFLVGSALALAIAAPQAALAKTDVDITINLGYGGQYGKNIKCWQAREIVDYRFSKVSTRDCTGRIYVFSGKRNGKWFIIRVDSRTGRIVDVDRWYR